MNNKLSALPRHFLLALAAFSFAIILFPKFSSMQPFPFWVFGTAVLVSIFFYINSRKTTVLLVVVFFVFGTFYTGLFEPGSGASAYLGAKVEITGKVTNVYPQKNYFLLKIETVNGKKLAGRNKIFVSTWDEDFSDRIWGERVSVSGSLQEFEGARNPGEFSEKSYWHNQGVGYRLDLEAGSVLQLSPAHTAQRFLSAVRLRTKKILENKLGSEESGILTAVVLGEKSALDRELYEDAQRAGIAHAFAVSGLHVGFLLVLYLAVARRLRLRSMTVFWGGGALLFGYAFLTGLTPSVIRAATMATITLFVYAKLYYRDGLNILTLSAWVVLLGNPFNIFTAGFQLSFLAAGGIIILAPKLDKLFKIKNRTLRQAIAVSFAAQVTTWPVLLYHFNIISPWSILFNLLFVPLVGILVPLTFLGILVGYVFLPLAQAFLYLPGATLYTVLFSLEKIMEKLPYASLNAATPHLSITLLYYFLLLILVLLPEIWENAGKKPYVAMIALLLVLSLIMVISPRPALEICFLDVGQGDAAVIFSGRQVTVIDGGPRERTLEQFLLYKGVNRIFLVVLTHPDADHINGLFPVLKRFKVDNLLLATYPENPRQKELEDMARKQGTKILYDSEVGRLDYRNGAFFKIISSIRYAVAGNDASLVGVYKQAELDVLFTGDMENHGWDDFMPLTGIEVIKVPHHGSKNSLREGVYAELGAENAIISVGRNNSYGHPHQVVLDALRESKTTVYRTDRHGAITLETDKRGYRIIPFIP